MSEQDVNKGSQPWDFKNSSLKQITLKLSLHSFHIQHPHPICESQYQARHLRTKLND